MIILDSKECNQIRYNFDNIELQGTIHSTPLIDKEGNKIEANQILSSYSQEDNILFILMPENCRIFVVKSKKKKHIIEYYGKLPKLHSNIIGIHCWFLTNEKIILTYYDNTSVYQWKIPIKHEMSAKPVFIEDLNLPPHYMMSKQIKRMKEKDKWIRKKKAKKEFKQLGNFKIQRREAPKKEENIKPESMKKESKKITQNVNGLSEIINEESIKIENEELKIQIDKTMKMGLKETLNRSESRFKAILSKKTEPFPNYNELIPAFV